MKKPLQPHLLKRVAPAYKGERTMRWRGRPPIGGQGSDRVSHRCSAPYTLLPLRGISPQGETRNLRRKTESHILHVPLRWHSPLWCRKAPKGGGHRRWLIDVMLFIPYDIESQSRNADFISIARKGNPPPSAPQALSPPERKRTQPAADRRP